MPDLLDKLDDFFKDSKNEVKEKVTTPDEISKMDKNLPEKTLIRQKKIETPNIDKAKQRKKGYRGETLRKLRGILLDPKSDMEQKERAITEFRIDKALSSEAIREEYKNLTGSVWRGNDDDCIKQIALIRTEIFRIMDKK